MIKLLQPDKINHNLTNYVICFTLAILVNYWVGLLTAVVVGLLKEFLWDKFLKRGCFEIMDLIANGLGIIEATLMYLIYYIWIL